MSAVRRVFRALGVAAAMAAATAGAQAATAQLGGPAAVLAGESFEVTLRGLGFDSLDGGGVNLSFAPALLELVSVQVDASWNFFSAPGAIDNVAGSLTDMSFNVWVPKQGNFDIATLQFKAKAGGLTSIDLLESVNFPFAVGGDPLTVTLVGTQVQINSPVPEPGAWLLLLGGLAGLGLRAARKSATRP